MTIGSIVAVCPVYNPPSDLAQRLTEFSGQVASIVVVDDGSAAALSLPGGFCVIRLPENGGIAAALNAGVTQAAKSGAQYVVTIDQDSEFPSDYIAQLAACNKRAHDQGLRPAVVGAVEFSGLRHPGHFHDGVMVVAESIQSGAMFEMAALASVDGFDESLVIDGVDTDVCLRLQDAGYDVVVAPTAFSHRLGEGHFVSLLGRQVWSSKHPPFRRYYITRNGLLLLRRHGRRHVMWAAVSARRLAVATLLAAREPEQRPAIWLGVVDALRGRRGQRWLPPAPANR